MKAREKRQAAPSRTETVTVRVYVDIHHRLDMLAAKERRKLQDVVNEALEEYLKRKKRSASA